MYVCGPGHKRAWSTRLTWKLSLLGVKLDIHRDLKLYVESLAADSMSSRPFLTHGLRKLWSDSKIAHNWELRRIYSSMAMLQLYEKLLIGIISPRRVKASWSSFMYFVFRKYFLRCDCSGFKGVKSFHQPSVWVFGSSLVIRTSYRLPVGRW